MALGWLPVITVSIVPVYYRMDDLRQTLQDSILIRLRNFSYLIQESNQETCALAIILAIMHTLHSRRNHAMVSLSNSHVDHIHDLLLR